MNLLSRLFGRKPERPFVEYPDGRLRSAAEALTEGVRLYPSHGDGRRALISWQGQGSRPDSYHTVDVRLDRSLVSFEGLALNLETACAEEGLSFAALKGAAPSELNAAPLADDVLARFLEAVFTKHLAVRPFEDTGDYCVGFEYERPKD